MADQDPFRILVVCTGNRARSQMAHGWMRHLGGSRVRVRSAGTQPKEVHPMAIRVMAEVGIDLSGHTSDHVEPVRRGGLRPGNHRVRLRP